MTATFCALSFQIDDRRLFDDEKPFVFARSSRHEEIGKRLPDLVRKNAEHFFKIEGKTI